MVQLLIFLNCRLQSCFFFAIFLNKSNFPVSFTTKKMSEELEYLKVLLYASQVEAQKLRKQKEEKDALLKTFQVKLEVEALGNLPAQRNLSEDISKREIQSLKKQVTVLKEEIGLEGSKLAIANAVQEQLKTDLADEKEKCRFTREVTKLYQMNIQLDQPSRDQVADYLQFEIRTVKEVLRQKEEELEKLMAENKYNYFENCAEKCRIQEETSAARREADLLRDEMKTLVKNMNAKSEELLGQLRDSTEKCEEMEIDCNIQLLELQKRHELLNYYASLG